MKHFTNFKNLVSIVLLAIVAFPSVVYACSCLPYNPNFCSYSHPSNQIALLVITKNIDYYLQEARVLENINQTIEDEFITILGQDGLNCGESLSIFAVGDTVIFSLIADLGSPFLPNTYYLDGCGRTYLRYANNQVTGHIHGTLETQDYSEFVSNMAENCLLGVDIDEPKQNPIKIYPTFTSNEVTLETGLYAMDAISVYSSNGQLAQQLEGRELNQKTLDVTDLPKGVYFVQVSIGGQAFTEKIVKM